MFSGSCISLSDISHRRGLNYNGKCSTKIIGIDTWVTKQKYISLYLIERPPRNKDRQTLHCRKSRPVQYSVQCAPSSSEFL